MRVTHTSFPRRQRGTQTTLPSFPRRREPRGARGRGQPDPARLEYTPEPSSTVIPAHTTVVPEKPGIQGSRGGRSTPANPARTEPALSTAEKPVLSLPKEPVQGSQLETNNSKLKTLPAERRIKERLEQHWHEPDPWAAPIDSTTPSRSPPLVTATRQHNRIATVPLPPFGGKIEMGALTPSPSTGEGGACPELAEGVRVTTPSPSGRGLG